MRKSGASIHHALKRAGACVPVAWLALCAGVVQGQVSNDQAAAHAGPIAAFDNLINDNCLECHNTTDWAGKLALDTLDLKSAGQEPEVWEKAIGKLRGRLMPPAGEKQPGQADIDALVSYLETSVDAAAKDKRVGHVPIQRLNRTEFAASVKGMLGVDIDPKQVLPTDIEVEGFSNIAGALGISPSFMEQYLSAARRVARLAVGEPVPKKASVFYRGGGGGGGQAGPGFGQTSYRDGFPPGTRGGVRFNHIFPADGEYRFNLMEGDSIDAGLYPRGMETSATMVLLIDGKEVARKEFGGPEYLALADRDGPKGREAIISKVSGITAPVAAGSHEVIATFIERSWAQSNSSTGGGRVLGTAL